MDTISIIIVSYNTKDLIIDCLRSVLKQDNRQYTVEVIVVDNASEDSSVQNILEKFPEITVIENNKNLGFAKANNQGLSASSGNYIFLLNPDTVVKDDALTKLWQFAKDHPDIGAVVPRLYFDDGSLQPSAYKMPTIIGAFKEYIFGQIGSYSKYAPNVKGPTIIEAAVGAAMLLPRQVIDQMGKLFDEKFYFYYEDIDLCRRLHKLGKVIYYLPSAEIIHYHGASTQKRGEWAYQQNQASAKLYFGTTRYAIITFILKYGQKWQKLLKRA